MLTSRSIGYPAGASAAGLAAERAGVGAGIRHEHRGAVDRAHQQAPPARGPGRRAADQVEQFGKRAGADPPERLGQRRATGRGQAQAGAAGQARQYLLVAHASEQHPREQHVHHHPGGQAAHPFLRRSGSLDRRVDQIE
nr:hypothetical protein [Tomitella gaofuii]